MKPVVMAALALVGLASFNLAPARAAAPPLTAFARLPAIERAAISPNGARMALLGGPADERTILLAQIDGAEVVTVRLGQSLVRDIYWVSDSLLLIDFSVLDRGTNYTNGQEWAFEVSSNVVIDLQGRPVRSPTIDALEPAPSVTVGDAGGERFSYQWQDPRLDAVQVRLNKTFADRDVRLFDWSRDRTRVVARVSAPSSPPAWFLFDARTGEASPLGEAYPDLAGATFGTTTWISYKAADGLDIPAYLTLPPGAGPAARPPLIVMPRRSPRGRDIFGFDWWVQALAVRGYAVLQPQFRGSDGFGETFSEAGRGEWGGKMQRDLVDGVRALADRGVIDPGRVAIVGAGYGGYAALFGATVHPSAYRCAVSVNGVSDLSMLVGVQDRIHGRDLSLVEAIEASMGERKANVRAYRKASPVFRVDRQAAPILLIHGEGDTTVPIDQSRWMLRALKAAGRPAELAVLEGGDHQLSSTAARTRMLESLFGFLDRCLPAGG